MNKEESIRQFAHAVEWLTAENVCYLIDGYCDSKNRHHWDTKLRYYLCHRKRVEKLHPKENPYRKIYGIERGPKGSRNLDHDIKLRNVLAVLKGVFRLENDRNADAKVILDSEYYIEMDNGTMGEEELRNKLKSHYLDKGSYRVIFFMASKPDELEESRLKKLFKISSEVLKGKKGRILGACYSEFLKDGRIQNWRGECVDL